MKRMRKLKDEMYNMFVRKNGRIWYEYERYVREHIEEHRCHRLRHVWLLIKLNWFYRVKRENTPYLYWDVPLNPNHENTEYNKMIGKEQVNEKHAEASFKSNESNKINIWDKAPISQLVEKLKNYDVISFDVFDTLLFRAVSRPQDVFRIVGLKLGIPNFKNIRIEAEKKIREQSVSGEIDIYEIYREIAKYVVIDEKTAPNIEMQVEKELVCVNPYIKSLYDHMIANGKTVIATSNMYLPCDVVRELLEKCGYTSFANIYVSCECKKNKKNGALFKQITSDIGEDRKFIHIGDNYVCDVEGARCAGWKAVYYQNVNEIGKIENNIFEFSSIGNSIYSALINIKCFSGQRENEYYEYGYRNAGFLIYGYCKWITNVCKAQGIEKILFASRDMKIVSDIYKDLFNDIPSQYVKVSRTATTRIAFEGLVQHYLTWHVKRRLQNGDTIKCVLEELEIDYLGEYLSVYDLKENEIFCQQNFDKVARLIEDQRDNIVNHYKEDRIAAKKYFRNILGESRKVCLVDMGWKSSTAVALNYFFTKINNWDVKLISVLLGTEGHEYVTEMETLGEIFPYVFSKRKNKDLMEVHNKNGNIWRRLYEIIFTSNEKSILSYILNEESNVDFQYLREEYRDNTIVTELHRGISDFCKDFNRIENKLNLDIQISEREAYIPLMIAFENQEYNYKLFKDFEVCFMAGNVKKDNAELFSDVIRKDKNEN